MPTEEEAKKKAAEEEAAKVAKEKKEAEDKKVAEEKEAAAKKVAEEKEAAAKKEAEEAEATVKKEAEAEATKKKESEADKPEVKTLQQAQTLLQEAAGKLEKQAAEVKELQSTISKLQEKADKFDKLQAEQKESAVNDLVKRKVDLGIAKKEDEVTQKEMLQDLDVKKIKLMTEELEKVSKVEVRKESLKGAEDSEVADAKKASLRKLMKGAGFTKEFLENFGKEDDED